MTDIHYNDGSAYLDGLARSLAEGNLAHVRANLPQLESLIAKLRRRRLEINTLLTKAQRIIDASAAPEPRQA